MMNQPGVILLNIYPGFPQDLLILTPMIHMNPIITALLLQMVQYIQVSLGTLTLVVLETPGMPILPQESLPGAVQLIIITLIHLDLLILTPMLHMDHHILAPLVTSTLVVMEAQALEQYLGAARGYM